MPGPLYHQLNTAVCPHGGAMQDVPTNARVLVSGMPVGVMSDVFPVAGCVFMIAGAPHPCVLCNWVTPAARVLVMGVPALLQTSVGLCVGPDQAPQGPPVVAVNQPRVIAT